MKLTGLMNSASTVTLKSNWFLFRDIYVLALIEFVPHAKRIKALEHLKPIPVHPDDRVATEPCTAQPTPASSQAPITLPAEPPAPPIAPAAPYSILAELELAIARRSREAGGGQLSGGLARQGHGAAHSPAGRTPLARDAGLSPLGRGAAGLSPAGRAPIARGGRSRLLSAPLTSLPALAEQPQGAAPQSADAPLSLPTAPPPPVPPRRR